MVALGCFLFTWIGFFPQAGSDEVPSIAKISPQRQAKIRFLNPDYLVFKPKVVAQGQKLPVVIYLHGAGGRGTDIKKIKGQAVGIWRGIARFDKGPCLVVAPQCSPKGQGEGDQKSTWNAPDLNQFLAELKATLPIDEKKIYLTGNSMGGYGTWVWGASNPEHFAAIAPISGGIGRGGPKDVTDEFQQWAENLTKVPVYAFAGGKDKVVPAERSERLVGAIRKAGGKNAKLKVYPEQGHNARQVVLSTPEFYDWMFSKSRK